MHLRAFGWHLLACLVIAPSLVQGWQSEVLTPNKPVTLQLRGGDSRTFSVPLESGQFTQFIALQRGVDVRLVLYDPEKRKLSSIDSPNGDQGPEQLSWMGVTAGTYFLEISVPEKDAKPGAVELSMWAPRAAVAADSRWQTVEIAFAEAVELSNREDEASRKAAIEKFKIAAPGWRELGNKGWEAYSHRRLAGLYSELKQNDAARNAFKDALVLYEGLSDDEGRRLVLRRLGELSALLADRDAALGYYTRLLKLQSDPKEIAPTLLSTGRLRKQMAAALDKKKAAEREALWIASEADLQRALGIQRTLKNRAMELQVLYDLGAMELARERPAIAIPYFDASLTLVTAANNRIGQAEVLDRIGFARAALGESPAAVDAYLRSAGLLHELKNGIEEAKEVEAAGCIYLALFDGPRSQELFERVLRLRQEAKNPEGEAAAWRLLGLSQVLNKNTDQALSAFNHDFLLSKTKALDFMRFIEKRAPPELYDPELFVLQAKLFEARELSSFDMVYDWFTYGGMMNWEQGPFYENGRRIFSRAGDFVAADSLNFGVVLQLGFELLIANEHLKALLQQNDLLKQALVERGVKATAAAAPEITDAQKATAKLTTAGFTARRDPRKAVGEIEDVIATRRRLKNQPGTSEALLVLCGVLFPLNENAKALAACNESLAISQTLGDRKAQIRERLLRGSIRNWTGDRKSALDDFEQSLVLAREFNDKPAQVTALSQRGQTFMLLGEKQKAIDELSRARELSRADSHPEGSGAVLSLLGLNYASLNDGAKSKALYELAVGELKRDFKGSQIFNKLAEKAHGYNDLGDAYLELGRKDEAMTAYREGLVVQRKFGRVSDEAHALDKLGQIYIHSQNPTERSQALPSFEQALALRRADGNRGREAEALHDLGVAYDTLGNPTRAIEFYHQALYVRHLLQDLEGEGETLNRLMLVWKKLGQPRLAVLYGKQAVSAFQQLRVKIRGLDKDLQKSFLTSRTGSYRELADLLIAQGRLPEAQQILDLLKEEEYFQYVRRDGNAAGWLDARADLTPVERAALEHYNEVAEKVTTLGRRFQDLSAMLTRSAQQELELAKLETDLKDTSRVFTVAIRQIGDEFNKQVRQDRVRTLEANRGLRADVREWGEGVVVLSTVLSEQAYSVIVTTRNVQVARRSAVPRAEIDKLVFDFRQAVQNPRVDPRPLGERLYRILIAPIEKDLRGVNAKTLVWLLDGTLRYLPIAALYDGKQYLAERFSNVSITLQSRTRLGASAPVHWRGLGLGVSKGFNGLSPLDAVPAELNAVIEDGSSSGTGILPGRVLLNEAFTEKSMTEQLRKGYPLVHIASHFVFHPGNEADSYLLLGDGGKLTLDLIRNASEPQFAGVDLLVLSACNTASGGAAAEGKEVEGFAVLAQEQGAKAVLATLWAVADQSTRQLMQAFYRMRLKNPALGKAEALRLSQLSLLFGSGSATEARTTRSADVIEPEPAATPPKFRPDPRAPYAHPFFWAPFVLTGNWR